jgi:hypothetical protein
MINTDQKENKLVQQIEGYIFKLSARYQWLMLVILATWEAEIKKITVRSQPRQIVLKTLSCKNPSQKKGWWGGSRCRP